MALTLCLIAFSSREPVSTSLENALDCGMTQLDDPSRLRIERMNAESLERRAREPARADGIERIDGALSRIRRSMARQSLGRRVLSDLGANVDPGLVEVLHAIAGSDAETPGAV